MIAIPDDSASGRHVESLKLNRITSSGKNFQSFTFPVKSNEILVKYKHMFVPKYVV
jgi:hypothetical protein